jgi:CBS domain-containing protein
MGTQTALVHASVADAMITTPKTHSVEISLADAERAFADPHIHMLLLVRDGVLHGTLVRTDLRPDLDPRRPAVALATLAGRTIGPDRALDEARLRLDRTMARRLAVTAADGRLLGLLCLKWTRAGFCSEADVRSHVEGRTPGPC